MKRDILFCKKNNIDGVVFGILKKDENVDKVRCKELNELAKPMQTTFHRAFAYYPIHNKSMDQLHDVPLFVI